MRNKLSDLNNHLFEQLERLQDDSLDKDKLEMEISRSKAITSLASQIIQNGNLAMRASEFAAEYGSTAKSPVLGLIEAGLIDDGKKDVHD